MTADEAISIITGAQVVVTNRNPDKFVEAVNRAILALDGERKRYKPKPSTIGDWIRSMTDEKLVYLLDNLDKVMCIEKMAAGTCGKSCFLSRSKCIKEWLQQPAKGKGGTEECT